MNEELPKDWKRVKLGESGKIISGGTPSTAISEYWNGKINWIAPSDLTGYKNKTIQKGKKSITESGLKNSSARLMPKGSVLFSSRAPIGYVVIADAEVCTNQGFKSIIPNENVSSDFLYYFLLASKRNAEEVASGTTFKEISLSKFSELNFPLPPKPTQLAIVSKIEELFSELEKGIESLFTAKQQLKTYRQSVLKWAFEGKLSESGFSRLKDEQDLANNAILQSSNSENPDSDKRELSKGWKWVKLSEVSKKKSTKALPKDYPDSKFIGMDCIQPHTLKPHFLYDFKEFKSAGNLFKKNQVLYGRMRPYLNKVYRAEFDGTCSGEFIILDCGEIFNPDLLKYILHSRNFVSFANSITTGDRPRISYEEISDYDIPLAPINEQNLIVQAIESRLSVSDKMEESITQSMQQAEALKQSILKKAFEGKLI